MKTKQPTWQCISNLGDCDPLNYDGFFVYVDKTGVYDPQCVLLELANPDASESDANRWQAYRFDIPRCAYDPATDTLSDNRFHPELAAWFATPENKRAERPQDTTYLVDVARFVGIDVSEMRKLLCSADPQQRAFAYGKIGEFHGFANLDAYPLTLTRADVYRLYRKECFPRSVRRVSKARITNGYGFTVSVGEQVRFRRANDPQRYTGTVKAIDRSSAFARAYGAQITFFDSPFTVTANYCGPVSVPSGETGPFAVATL